MQIENTQYNIETPRPGCPDMWNAFMVQEATFTEKTDIPICPCTANTLPTELISYEDAKALYKKELKKGNNDFFVNAFIHFYIDDQKFDGKRSSIWLYPYDALDIIKHFSGIITPDFSTNAELNNKFIEFNYQDTDMLEISVNPKTNLLKRLSLSLCNHYSIEDAMLSVPAADEGSLSIEGPASTECDKFLVKVFIDGIQIDLSSKEAVHNYKCGQGIYSISADNTLTAVYIPSLADNELAHAKKELLGE